MFLSYYRNLLSEVFFMINRQKLVSTLLCGISMFLILTGSVSAQSLNIDTSRVIRNNSIGLKSKDRVPLLNPKYIVLHHTAMSNDAAAVRELNITLYTHYIVEKTGKITQVLGTNVVAEGSWDRAQLFDSDQFGNVTSKLIASLNKRPIDRDAVHIEINFAPQNGESINQNQIKATAGLIAKLVKEFKIQPTGILGHSSIQPCGSNLFKDYDGDWFKFNEPHGLMYNYTKSNACQAYFSPGMYNLTNLIRQYGVWNDGPYNNMTNTEVANIIYRRNFNNSAMLMSRNNSPEKARMYNQLNKYLRK